MSPNALFGCADLPDHGPEEATAEFLAPILDHSETISAMQATAASLSQFEVRCYAALQSSFRILRTNSLPFMVSRTRLYEYGVG